MEARIRRLVGGFVATGAIIGALLCAAQAQQPAKHPKLITLHNFRAANDGAQPAGALTPDGTGGFYGIAEFGGPNDNGVAFQLVPPAEGAQRWDIVPLHKFGPLPDGRVPDSTLIAGPGGVLFGTTFVGGRADKGTVFRLTPPTAPNTGWRRTILHAFTGGTGDGERVQAQLLLTEDDALLGTTYQGGAMGSGTVYMLTPPVSGTKWTQTLLHSFDGALGGGFPQSGLVAGRNGVYFGMTTRGGANDRGTVYSLRPPAAPGRRWGHEVLYSFEAGETSTIGGLPTDNLLIDRAGALYGITNQGGSAGLGTVFRLAREGQPKTWQYRELHSFGAAAGDGFTPQGGLIADADGSLYGTTTLGGASNHGSIYKLTPPAQPSDPWTETVLHSFTGDDGATPQGSLIMDAGLFYGTTSTSGRHNKGTVFSFRQ